MTARFRELRAAVAAATLLLVAFGPALAGPVPDGAVGGTVATAAATDPAGLAVSLVDPAGSPLPGACLEIWTATASGAKGTLVPSSRRCDSIGDAEGKLRPADDGRADGSLGWSNLAAGRYLVVETAAPQIGRGYALVADTGVTLVGGAVASVTLRHEPNGALTIYKVDATGKPLPAACFALVAQVGALFACDGPSDPRNGPGDGKLDGVVVMSLSGDVKDGAFTLRETRPPDGYAAAAEQTVEVRSGRATVLTIANATGGGGGLAVALRDPAGRPLTGGCLELWTATGNGSRGTLVAGSRRCDSTGDAEGKPRPIDDGRVDGSIGWSGLAARRYVVVETEAPPGGRGYALAADSVVAIQSGVVSSIDIIHPPLGALTITKLDPAGKVLPGACFALIDAFSGTIFACDGPTDPRQGPGDALADGVVVMALSGESKPGQYTLREARPPDGYAASPDKPVTISFTTATAVTITDGPATGLAGLAVALVDPAGGPVTNACLELWTATPAGARGTLVSNSRRCDSRGDSEGKLRPTDDGRADGSVGWPGVAAGRYLIVETLAPQGGRGHALAPDTAVTLAAGGVAGARMVHPRLAALTISKVGPAGEPLPGVCFALLGSGPTIFACDGATDARLGPGDGVADGILVMALGGESKPGTYTLRESRPPDGYAAAPDQAVELLNDKATSLTLVNAPAAAGGGGTPIIGLELEVDSRITIETLSGMPVGGGLTTAKGRIRLDGDTASGRWTGTGSLASETSSGTAGCPSIHIEGSGTYDWMIRSATVGPGLKANEIVVNMDSGPISESPDGFVMDTCNGTFDGTLNTWENLFFDVYRSRFQAAGFRVDGWTLVGGPDAWTAGGVIAEAHWSGSCATALVVACSDETTFRLIGAVIGTGPAASPGATPGGGIVATPSPGPDASSAAASPASSSPVVPLPPGAVACSDFAGCLTSSPVLLIFGGFAVVIVVGGAVFLRLRAMDTSPPTFPAKAESVDLSGTASDMSMSELSLDVDKLTVEENLVFDKHPPDADQLTVEGDPLAFEKLTTDFQKVDVDKLTVESDPLAFEKLTVDGSQLAEPLELPEVPGSNAELGGLEAEPPPGPLEPR